jgi:hypothetical protein
LLEGFAEDAGLDGKRRPNAEWKVLDDGLMVPGARQHEEDVKATWD